RSELSRGLLLEGAALDRGLAYPGQTVFSTLRWRVSGALPGSLPHLVLRQSTATLALSQTSSLSVTGTVFPVGRPLLEHMAFKIPVEVQEGIAEIVLVSGEQHVTVGELELEVGEHTFSLPDLPYSIDAELGDIATLSGFDLAPAAQIQSGDSLHLILAWRAGTGTEGTDFTVFVHLLAGQGNIIAQHDGKPVNGTRLTGGWLPGEILLDEHLLEIPVSYAGPATLRVGMYNAASGMRLPWSSGSDALTLPFTLTVTPSF
ncbi:MAG: hypothetical protein JW981_11275, partial [Anaerolineae bacterium]|nr:hypothetical protein [Anaerolineae bacterium]